MRIRNRGITALTAAAAAVALTAGLSACSEVSADGSKTTSPTSSGSPSTGSASPSPSPATPSPYAGELKTVFDIKTDDKVFFITIDDGRVHNKAALKYIKDNQIPVTAFPTKTGIRDDFKYFTNVTQFGGTIEDHTWNHERFKTEPDLKHSICDSAAYIAAGTGRAPTMLRPPFGQSAFNDVPAARNKEISDVATSCGLKYKVLWDVDVRTVNDIEGSVKQGSIVLLHFTEDLLPMLEKVMALGSAAELKPAALVDYLK